MNQYRRALRTWMLISFTISLLYSNSVLATWSEWQDLGGILTSAPTVSSWEQADWMCLPRGVKATPCGADGGTAAVGTIGKIWEEV